MQTVKFFTLGCKVNQYDTQEIRERFIRAGFKEITNGIKADIYVINTCTVTSAADRKSRYFIHSAHRQNPKAKVIVTGCYAQLDSGEIAQIPGVTRVIKNQDKERILKLLNWQERHNKHSGTGISNFSGHTRAFLKVQDGCTNFCSYCKVPLVRGPLKSKPPQEITAEARRLVKNGFKEIVLCGICLGAYGRDLKKQVRLVDAIEAIEDIEGLLRIRLSSIEGSDICDRLIKKMARSKKLCRHLHIPIQSGDDAILRKMNRRFRQKDYLNLIRKIRKSVPDIAITTDVMVGFPGETEENFGNTIKLIRRIIPLRVHIFPYSPRPGTQAHGFRNKIAPLEIKKRMLRLNNIAQGCSYTYKKRFLNRKMDVLMEECSRDKEGYWRGYTDNYIKVLVKSAENLKNQLDCLKLKSIIRDYILADFPKKSA